MTRKMMAILAVMLATMAMASVAAAEQPGVWVDGGRSHQVHPLELPGQWVD